MEFIPSEKAVPIRNPASANLLIDSRDRVGYNNTSFSTSFPDQTAANFTISKNNSLMNGFFTRIAPTEVCLDWCVDNLNQTNWANTTIEFRPAALNGSNVSTITLGLVNGQYTTAQVLNDIVARFNANTTCVANNLILSTIQGSNGNYRGGEVSLQMFNSSNAAVQTYQIASRYPYLAQQLDLQGIDSNVSNIAQTAIGCPKLLPTSFIDIASPNLTYNQNLKDSTTALTSRDVLFRWYFADTVPPPTDQYGYPIYQGYKRFIQRREVAFPKQINWKPNQPIGQLAFQVLDDQGRVLPPSLIGTGTSTANLSEMEWQMTCLVSEV